MFAIYAITRAIRGFPHLKRAKIAAGLEEQTTNTSIILTHKFVEFHDFEKIYKFKHYNTNRLYSRTKHLNYIGNQNNNRKMS